MTDDKRKELAERIERHMQDAAGIYEEGQIFDLYPDDQSTVLAALRAPPPGDGAWQMVPSSFIREFMAHRHFWAAKDIDVVARKDGKEYRLEGDWLKEFTRSLAAAPPPSQPERGEADPEGWDDKSKWPQYFAQDSGDLLIDINRAAHASGTNCWVRDTLKQAYRAIKKAQTAPTPAPTRVTEEEIAMVIYHLPHFLGRSRLSWSNAALHEKDNYRKTARAILAHIYGATPTRVTEEAMQAATRALVNAINKPGSWNAERSQVGFMLRDGYCDFSVGLRAAVDAALAHIYPATLSAPGGG